MGIRRYYVILFGTMKLQKSQIDSIMRNRVAGIIIKPTSNNLELLHNLDIPMVFLNSYFSDQCSCVEVDNRVAELKATEHLIKTGYRSIVFIGGKDALSNDARMNGYKDALKKFNIPVRSEFIKNGEFSIESGYSLIKKVFESGSKPDAVVCGNDVIALGVLQYAREQGMNIPEEFGVIGFDNIELSSLPQINLSTVAQPRKEMGDYAVRLLIKQFDEEGKKEIEKKIFKTSLILRSTTR